MDLNFSNINFIEKSINKNIKFNENICFQKVLGPFGCSLPVEIPKSFDPIFIKVRKAAKKPKTASKYIFLINKLI